MTETHKLSHTTWNCKYHIDQYEQCHNIAVLAGQDFRTIA